MNILYIYICSFRYVVGAEVLREALILSIMSLDVLDLGVEWFGSMLTIRFRLRLLIRVFVAMVYYS